MYSTDYCTVTEKVAAMAAARGLLTRWQTLPRGVHTFKRSLLISQSRARLLLSGEWSVNIIFALIWHVLGS